MFCLKLFPISQFRTTLIYCAYIHMCSEKKICFLSLCEGRNLRGSSCSFLLFSNIALPRKSGQWECTREGAWIQRNRFWEEWSPFTGKRINTIKYHRFQFLFLSYSHLHILPMSPQQYIYLPNPTMQTCWLLDDLCTNPRSQAFSYHSIC